MSKPKKPKPFTVTCPSCGSTNTVKISKTNKVGAAVTFGVFSLGHLAKTFRCKRCGYKW